MYQLTDPVLDDVVGSHQVVVFVFQHVAMEDVAARVSFESDGDGEHFARIDKRSVFPSGFVVRRRTWISCEPEISLAKGCGVESLAF
jgi:hypothetical protein